MVINQSVLDKAEILIEALPYIKRFGGNIIVVKYGGSAMKDESLKKHVIEDVVLMKLIGFKPIIVHGGGKEISKWVEKSGIESEFYNGLRVTDADTLEIADMVLGKVNSDLVTYAQQLGAKAIGISGRDGGLLTCEKAMPDGRDIGYVGNVVGVDPTILNDLLEHDFLPIIYPIGADEEGQSYNINGDHAAASVAQSLKAGKLAYLTDTAGVYRDFNDPESLISELYIDEAEQLIAEGAIGGGMIPKVRNCIETINEGVKRVHILDGRIPHCLLLEFFTDKGIGTAIMDKAESRYYNEK